MPIALALAISALLHAAAVSMPSWDLADAAEPEPATLEAQLTPPPQKPAAPAEAAAVQRAKAQRLPAPRRVTSAPTSATAAEPVLAAAAAAEPLSAPAAAPAAAPALPPAPPVMPWARDGRIHFVVTYGDGGFVIGETTHEWHVDGDRYSIRSIAEPKGLAALRGKTRIQTSAGEVSAAGLRPTAFRDQREGRDEEGASLDWQAMRAVFSGGRGEAPLTAGTQDLVSVFYQLAWLAPRQTIDFAVATASRIGRWTFEWMGEESITAAGLTLSTLHFRTRADADTVEIWLAPAHDGLPVKIRYTDRRGDVFEQVADQLELKR